MSVNPSPLGPKPQFELSDGTPAVGNQLFFYVAGSVGTKQNTYTDSTGGSANTNPIVLNSLGQPTTQIWFTSGQSYKVVYAPSTDTDPPTSPIWTIDNLLGINDTTGAVSEWAVGPAPTFVSATSFTLVGDQTSTFTVGRRVKTTNTSGTIYSTITVSAFAAVTTVTVVNDSGTLDSGLSAVSYGILSAANSSIPSVKLSSGNWTLINTLTASSSFTASASVTLSGTVSPAQITSNQNDYNPTSLSSASTLRLNSDASRNVTGLAGGADGRIITLVNVGSNPIVLTNQDVLSTAANRFLLKSDTTLAADQSITFRYDNTTARWRPLSGGVTKQPTRQSFTSGSGTYTTATGATRIYVRLIGGGGGGSGNGAAGAGTTGGNSTFSTLTGSGGVGGNATAAGAGGAAAGGDVNIPGGTGGGSGLTSVANVFMPGGFGGVGPFGGAGAAGTGNANGGTAATNSGSGGGGGGAASAGNSGAGGGAGGYCEKWFLAPAATLSYAVGAGGAGTSGTASTGGTGATGIVIVDEFYD